MSEPAWLAEIRARMWKYGDRTWKQPQIDVRRLMAEVDRLTADKVDLEVQIRVLQGQVRNGLSGPEREAFDRVTKMGRSDGVPPITARQREDNITVALDWPETAKLEPAREVETVDLVAALRASVEAAGARRRAPQQGQDGRP